MELMDIIYLIFSFIMGAVIGSFLNVLIYRLPNKMSIVSPGSHCFTCNAPIKWYDNIPILSYIILRGKCRNCKTPYSPQYFLIELFTAIMYCLIYLKFKQSMLSICFMLVISCLIVIFFIDLKHYIIPDSAVIGILIVAFFSLFIKNDSNLIIKEMNYLNRVIGLGVVIILFVILYLIGKLVKKELMGFGDIKLLGVMGLLLGFKLLLLSIFIASTLALIKEVLFLKAKNKIIPFGPYLSVGFTIIILIGPEILNWYSLLFV